MPAAPTPNACAAARAVASDAACWRVQLLGAPALVRTDTASLVRLSPKDAALLALIAIDGPVEATRVAALVWPDVASKKADTNLRQRLFRLRRDTGAALVDTGALLQLAAGVETDLPATLAQLGTDPGAGTEPLLGDLAFDGMADLADWLRSARTHWCSRRDGAMAAAAAACESAGAVAKGLSYALRLADSEPLSEHAQRRVMRLHYLRGDCSAAIASFE